jgi:hypothetical protein
LVIVLRMGRRLSLKWYFSGVPLLCLAVAHSSVAAENAEGPGNIESSQVAVDQTVASFLAKTSGFFRIDTDASETQFIIGAKHRLNDWFGISSNIYAVHSLAELDVGPSFDIGPVTLTPMVGVAFDFARSDFVKLVPQFYAVFNSKRIRAESWHILHWNDPLFGETSMSYYIRTLALWRLSELFAVGPQFETDYRLRASRVSETGEMLARGMARLPLGGLVEVSYGSQNKLGLFLGYDLYRADDSDGIAGRFTYIRSW